VMPSARAHKLSAEAIQRRIAARVARSCPHHQRATGGRENESEGHCSGSQ
jgi:hypothetical protein